MLKSLEKWDVGNCAISHEPHYHGSGDKSKKSYPLMESHSLLPSVSNQGSVSMCCFCNGELVSHMLISGVALSSPLITALVIVIVCLVLAIIVMIGIYICAHRSKGKTFLGGH